MKIILISGKAGHGKTTFANFLEEELMLKGEVLRIAFGDLLKDICCRYYDWDGEKNEEGRALLQLVGTEIVRERDEDFWTDHVARFAAVMRPDFVIIDDWRFVEEVERLSRFFSDITTIRVERYEKWVGDHPDYINVPYKNPVMTKEQLAHRSETELENYICEYIITNTSINSIREAAQELVKEWELSL